MKMFILFLSILTIFSCSKSKEEFFIQASENNNKERVISLLINGTDINAKDDLGYTALMKASSRGHVEMVKLLLEHSADVKAKTIFGTTALMDASWYGHLEIVKILLDTHTNRDLIDAQTIGGWTPLFFAALGGNKDHPKIVRILLKRGANPGHQDFALRTPLYWAKKDSSTILCR